MASSSKIDFFFSSVKMSNMIKINAFVTVSYFLLRSAHNSFIQISCLCYFSSRLFGFFLLFLYKVFEVTATQKWKRDRIKKKHTESVRTDFYRPFNVYGSFN